MRDCDEQNYVSSRYTLHNDIDMNWCCLVKYYLSWIFNITGKILSENGTSNLLFQEMSGDDIYYMELCHATSLKQCLPYLLVLHNKHANNIRTNGSNLVALSFQVFEKKNFAQVLVSYPKFFVGHNDVLLIVLIWLKDEGKTKEHFGLQIFQLLIQVFLLHKEKQGSLIVHFYAVYSDK